jgi:hypothetical protein
MELNDSEDLLKFIFKETKNKSDLDLNYAYKILCKSFPKMIMSLYKSAYNISNINAIDIIVAGCNMLHNVYWFILRQTNNCEVALFLAETSIKIFIDSLAVSPDALPENAYKLAPSISDAVRYSYQKTIGPIPPNLIPNPEIDTQQLASLITKMIVVQTIKQIIYAGLLPNNFSSKTSEVDKSKLESIPAKLDILIEYVQQQLRSIINNIWNVLFYIVNQHSENLTDKLYHQINYYINNYSSNNTENLQVSMTVYMSDVNNVNWVNVKQKKIAQIIKNIDSLIQIIKEFGN